MRGSTVLARLSAQTGRRDLSYAVYSDETLEGEGLTMLSDIFGRFRSLPTMNQILLTLLTIVLSGALSLLIAVLALLLG